jgi:hypothetical protein
MRRAMILGLFLLASLPACSGETPTGVRAPERPRFDGGWTMGSGNSAGTTPATTSGEDTTATRGGWTMGSGN